MYLLFEEGGNFRAGTVLSDSGTSLQVETSHGKRVKVKRAAVLLEYDKPQPIELIDQSAQQAQELDAAFLWEVCEDGEFGFAELAQAYYGHPPSAPEAVAVLHCLQQAPIYFHRKGKGRFRRAPADVLQAALTGMERKRLQAEQIQLWSDELVAGRMPSELEAMMPQLLYRPDRNRPEVKALEAAAVACDESTAQLLLRVGAVASSHDLHLNRFLFEYFAQGTACEDIELPAFDDQHLPCADVAAFSIDDASTTEIDDAFSVTPCGAGGWRIGIHIAAPGLGFGPDSAPAVLARERLSTVYMPGKKITMLPASIISRFSLDAGRVCPALSLYLDLSPALAVQAVHTCIERVPVVENLRLHQLEAHFNEQTLEHGLAADCPQREALLLLWELATVLEAGRGKTGSTPEQTDFSFDVDWNESSAEGAGQVSIKSRQRGAPLDKLVSEMMIFANAHWASALADGDVAALYRIQNGGKVRMSTLAEPHEGLGVDCYMWASSPLRRYIDLANQWQLLALFGASEPPFALRSPLLMAAMRDFEVTYAAYAQVQRLMERYWCLRWLRQNNSTEIEATVLRENTVRLSGLPFVSRIDNLPTCPQGSRVLLALEQTDLLNIDLSARYIRTLDVSDENALSLQEQQA